MHSHYDQTLPVRLEKTHEAGRYLLTADDIELLSLLREDSSAADHKLPKKRRSKFRDFVFTRQTTVFDRQNNESAASPFHGFFSLFWFVKALLDLAISDLTLHQDGSSFDAPPDICQ